MKKINLMSLLLALMFVFCLFGCNTKEIDTELNVLTEEDLKAYDGTIGFDFRVPSGIVATALAPLIEKFELEWEGKIDVELVIETDGYDGVRKTTVLDLNSKAAPTMVLGYPDHFAEYFSGNYILDLNDYIEAENYDLSDYVESYLDENRISDDNDHLYGLPLNKSTEVLVYNKTVFDAMNYNVPKSYADVEALCKQILDDCKAGKLDNIIAIAEGEKKPSEYLEKNLFVPFSYDSTDNAFITMCRQFGGEYTERENIMQGYALFDNEQVKAGLAYFQGLSNQGYYAVAESFGESYASNAFKALKCLMTVGSSAGVGYNVPDGNKFEIGIAPIPYKDAEKKYVIQQGTNICILNQNTNEQRAAAWQLFKFLTSPEMTAEFCMATGSYLPVRKSAYELDSYKDYLENPPLDKVNNVKAARVGLDYLEEGYVFFVDKPFVGSAEIRDEVGALFTKVVVNKEDIAQSIKDSLNTLGPAYRK